MFQEEELESEQEYMLMAYIDDCHRQLTLQIKETIEERDSLKSITQNQLKNLNELQEKCEESYIAISQLPENNNTASDRYEEVMTDITKLQNKQCEINELLNLSLREFDENMQLMNISKDNFNSEINIANQRLLIYQSNINEIKELAKKNITSLEESIHAKRILLEMVKTHLSNISQHQFQEELKQLTQNKHNSSQINYDLRQKTEEVEEQLKKANEEEQSLEFSLGAKQKILNEELESLKTELELSNNYMEELQEELRSVTSNIEHQKNENGIFKNKLDEAKMLSSNLKNSLESKHIELHANQNELEKRNIKVANLRNIINEIPEMKMKCSVKKMHIEELNNKQNMLINQYSSLKDRLKAINERIDNDTLKYNNILAETKEISCVITTIKAKTDLQQRELSKAKNECEEKINSLSDDIKQLTINNSKLVESIKEKEERINSQEGSLLSLKSELELKINTLKERRKKNSARDEELSKKLEDLKMKKEILQTELQSKKDAVIARKRHNETVRSMLEKIAFEKDKYDNLMKSYQKETEDLKASYNDQLELRIQELQTLKTEKTKKWEAFRDSASKAEFSYFRVKSEAQRLKAEVSCLNENLKTYNCENEMLKMLIVWMKNDTSNSETDSIQSKPPAVSHEVPEYTSQSDSSFDEATESEQAEDLVIQRYQVSRVYSQRTPDKNEGSYYSVCEKPILITTEKYEESQNAYNQGGIGPPNAIKQEHTRPGEPGPSIRNIECKAVKHKLEDVIVIDDWSSDNTKMKRPKTPQKKVLTKKANLKDKKKINVAPKKRTILDLVIDSSN